MRQKIVQAVTDLIATIDGSGTFLTDLYGNVDSKLQFWDEVSDFPTVCVVAGDETREYLPAGFKWGFLTVKINVYVKDENSQQRLEDIFSDIESLLDSNNTLSYDTNKNVEDIRIISIITDEGVLQPLGIGEITLQIQYAL